MRFYFSLILAFVISQSLFAQGTVDSYIAINEIKNENTFVLIFANENYKYEQSVPFAHNDGEVFNLYCEKTLGIPPKHIHYVADATLNDMYMQLQWLETLLKTYAGDARSIIYYSGHGMPSEDGKHSYLLPVDGNSRLHKSGLSTESLYKQLGALPSKGNIIILDACFSGTKRDGEMLSSSRGVAIKPKDEAVLGKTVVFSASSGDETAYPYKEKEHGLFTYFLLEQLQKNGGFISFGDLSDNVTRLVTRCSIVENGKPQTPTVRASASAKDWREWLFADKRAVKFETISRMSSPKRETSELNSNSEVLFTSEWLTKEVDSKMRDYVRSRFNIFGTSLSLKDAVTEHYTKIERSHGKLKTMAGFADGRTTDEASYKAQNSVANRYAVMCSTTLKGRLLYEIPQELMTYQTEYDSFFAAYEDEMDREIRVLSRSSYSVRRIDEDGKTTVEIYYLVDVDEALQARLNAFDNIQKEFKIVQKHKNMIMDCIKEEPIDEE